MSWRERVNASAVRKRLFMLLPQLDGAAPGKVQIPVFRGMPVMA